jgi:hypothetical protein
MLKNRLLELIEMEGLNNNQFYRKTGLGIGFLDKVGEKLKRPSVEKISTSFPHWNIDYLQTGKGEKLKKINNFGHTTFGNKSPITGNIEIFQSELDKAYLKIEYLEQRLKDKDEIIELLKKQVR